MPTVKLLQRFPLRLTVSVAALMLASAAFVQASAGTPVMADADEPHRVTDRNAQRTLDEGKRVFRFDTFGDEAFWGDTLQLHRAIEGAGFGGVGPGVSPKTALAVGLRVDVDALPDLSLIHI